MYAIAAGLSRCNASRRIFTHRVRNTMAAKYMRAADSDWQARLAAYGVASAIPAYNSRRVSVITAS